MHTKEGTKTMAKDTKNNKKYESVEEYYASLSRPCKVAFKVGIKYALKTLKEEQASKNNLNEMMCMLAK